jgi:hypothetical protein
VPAAVDDAAATVLVMTLVIGASEVGVEIVATAVIEPETILDIVVGVVMKLPGMVVVIKTIDARSEAGIALPTPVPVN